MSITMDSAGKGGGVGWDWGGGGVNSVKFACKSFFKVVKHKPK